MGTKTTLGFRETLRPAIVTINCWILIDCTRYPPPPPPPPHTHTHTHIWLIQKTYTKLLFQMFSYFIFSQTQPLEVMRYAASAFYRRAEWYCTAPPAKLQIFTSCVLRRNNSAFRLKVYTLKTTVKWTALNIIRTRFRKILVKDKFRADSWYCNSLLGCCNISYLTETWKNLNFGVKKSSNTENSTLSSAVGTPDCNNHSGFRSLGVNLPANT